MNGHGENGDGKSRRASNSMDEDRDDAVEY
jgi:hypothetical protein